MQVTCDQIDRKEFLVWHLSVACSPAGKQPSVILIRFALTCERSLPLTAVLALIVQAWSYLLQLLGLRY
jgi:hypothetical protein